LDGITTALIIGDLEVDGAGTMALIIGGTILFGTHTTITLHMDGALIMAFTILIMVLL
jgi:hypothetical protein